MNSIDSYQSKATINAQSIISKIATRNGQADNGSLITALDEETVSAAWNAFGLHISRQLRMGRGVAVNKFGTFSFSAPDVVLDGVTNPVDRDKQPRQPVFLVAKVLLNQQYNTQLYKPKFYLFEQFTNVIQNKSFNSNLLLTGNQRNALLSLNKDKQQRSITQLVVILVKYQFTQFDIIKFLFEEKIHSSNTISFECVAFQFFLQK